MTWSTVIVILTKEAMFLHINVGLQLSDTFLCHSHSENSTAPFPRDVTPPGPVQLNTLAVVFLCKNLSSPSMISYSKISVIL